MKSYIKTYILTIILIILYFLSLISIWLWIIGKDNSISLSAVSTYALCLSSIVGFISGKAYETGMNNEYGLSNHSKGLIFIFSTCIQIIAMAYIFTEYHIRSCRNVLINIFNIIYLIALMYFSCTILKKSIYKFIKFVIEGNDENEIKQ